MYDVVEAHATATDFLWGIGTIRVASKKLIVERFDREGLNQLQPHTRPLVAVLKSSHSCSFFSFVADEDLCGRNVLLLTFYSLRELLRYPRECICVVCLFLSLIDVSAL